MKSASRVALALLFVPALLAAPTKHKPTVPAVFNNARYVWVESMDGDAFNPRLLPEDRQAIGDVEEALRDWNRYVLTASRREAELVFIIRKGRAVSGWVGGSVSRGTAPVNQPQGRSSTDPGAAGSTGNGRGVGGGAEAGPPDDMLEVRMLNPDGTLGTMLWERSLHDGLNEPELALIAQLRNAVEHDYPAKSPATKP